MQLELESEKFKIQGKKIGNHNWRPRKFSLWRKPKAVSF